jgi:glycosyltransferase involved in cell wall biosynthesis
MLHIAPDDRTALGRAARQRIIKYFDIRVIARQYEAVYRNMAGERFCVE